MITPVIIVKDASKTIAQTLESLKWFEEVIVYDTGSLDNTLEIVRNYKNVKLFQGAFYGFGESKNIAAKLARYDWILSIDADEVVGPVLLNSIKNMVPELDFVYRFKRTNFYRNNRINFSGWGKEYVTRIYNRKNVSYNHRLVHEKLEINSYETRTIEGELMHFSYHSVSDFVRKRDLYSELFALENAGKRKSSLSLALLKGTFAFLNTFLIKASFLDGYRGVLIAVSNANVTFYKYLKLYEANLQNHKRISLVINAGKNPELLKYSVQNIIMQVVPPAEIIIAFNPEIEETEKSIDNCDKQSFVPIVKVKCTSQDFEEGKWLDKVLKVSENEYYIFIESGNLPGKNFVLAHSNEARKEKIILGKTVLLKNTEIKDIVENKRINLPLFSFICMKIKLLGFLMLKACLIKHRKKNKFLNLNKLNNVSFFKEDLQTESTKVLTSKYRIIEYSGKENFQKLKRRFLTLKGLLFSMVQEDKKPQVLVCLDRLKYLNCGLGQVSYHLGKNLVKRNNDQLNFSLLLPQNGFAEFENKISSIRQNFINILFPLYMKNYDLVHITHQLPGYSYNLAKKKILTIHDLNFIFTKNKRKSKRYIRKVQSNIYKTDAIVFISEFTKETCLQHINIPKSVISRVIYNGVEPPVYNNEKPKWLQVDEYLFSIGQFLEKKNFHVLIPFLLELPENIRLVIAGENKTSYGDRIRQLIGSYKLENRIILPGGIPENEKNYLFHHCKAFLFPSIAEGFGLPVVEAMLCHKPVFCSNRTSLKEIGNKFAFFWNDFDPVHMKEEFDKGIITAQESNHLELQFNYANTYTYNRNVNQYIELYKEILEK
ncbi:MAG: glycosyltransferase [Bacteroidales bacterium]